MSRRGSNKMLVHQLSSVLPDDRPITAINIVEDIEKCPPNFIVVSRTYDQDTDADLWRESGLFIKKKGRYICFSKAEGLSHCVVEDITIIHEREAPPEGYSMISHTVDSIQKAWRKKQLCYKLRHKDLCSKAVTDIIICSRIFHKGFNIAPKGFVAAGTINGVCVCYKTVELSSGIVESQSYVNIESLQSVSPNPSNGTPHKVPPERPPKPKFSPKPANGIYPQIGSGNSRKECDRANDHDYEILNPSVKIRPTRPAPQPPTTSPSSSVTSSAPIYGTLPGSSDLDGVPFVLNSRLCFHSESANNKLPVIKLWTEKDLKKEFSYDFRAERET